MNIIDKTVIASGIYEKENGELKKIYLKEYVRAYHRVVKKLEGYKGFFGLGYPFYALGNKFYGDLPIIQEQFRYNSDLFEQFHDQFENSVWPCEQCLKENLGNMPNLKSICYRCPTVSKEISPRKVINRLPDMDLCLVVEDSKVEQAKEELMYTLPENGLTTSDIDPIGAIDKVYRIASSLKMGKLPTEWVPLDTHLFPYNELMELMHKVEPEMAKSLESGKPPYLATTPDSLRKTWQKDDTAINFAYDFLYSFTDYDFDQEMKETLIGTRKIIASKYTNNQIERMVLGASIDSQKRRYYSCPTLKLRFNERINSWKEE